MQEAVLTQTILYFNRRMDLFCLFITASGWFQKTKGWMCRLLESEYKGGGWPLAKKVRISNGLKVLKEGEK